MVKKLSENKILSGNEYHCWTFTNPEGVNVRCEAVLGTGETALYKNDRKVGESHIISSEPGHPTAIHLNTGKIVAASGGTHVVQSGEFLSRIARLYGVTLSELLDTNRRINPDHLWIGQTLKIPDSRWEIWIKELAEGKHTFKVELVPK